MILSTKISGLGEVLKAFQDENILIDGSKLDAIVYEAAQPVVAKIKENYIAAGHIKTGALVDSITSFRGSKRSRIYDQFTYYVGPKYSTKNSLSAGGNAAHLLEWGTKIRHKADIKKGGYAGKGTGKNRKNIYGAKISVGATKGTGTLRKSFDEMKQITLNQMETDVLKLIIATAKKNGLEII